MSDIISSTQSKTNGEIVPLAEETAPVVTGGGERFAAFFHLVKAMYESRKGLNGGAKAEKLLIDRLEARSADFPDPIFLSVCDRERAIHDIGVILDKNDDSSETLRQLMTTVKVIKVFLKNVEFESSPHTSEQATPNTDETSKSSHEDKPVDKKTLDADDSGSVEEKKKKKKHQKKAEESAKSKNKKEAEVVSATKKRKARKSDSSSEDSVEKKRDAKKRRCAEDKDASKAGKKEKKVVTTKPPTTPRSKKRENELYVLRDGAKIVPLFIKEGQTLTNFVPTDVEQGDSSVFVWSTETHDGDEKDLNVYHKKIVFSKRWFAIDVRDAKNPKLTLKSLTKTEMKKRGCEVTKSDIEDKFVALVRKHNLVKPAVVEGAEGSEESQEKPTGKEAKKFMSALRKKNGVFQTRQDAYWRIDRKSEDDIDEKSFWTNLTELLPSKINAKKARPSKYAEFEGYAGKRYAKYTIPTDITYDSEGTAIHMPVYLENAFTNTKKLMSGHCNGFVSTSAWYFDNEQAFKKACEGLREISVAVSQINRSAKKAKKVSPVKTKPATDEKQKKNKKEAEQVKKSEKKTNHLKKKDEASASEEKKSSEKKSKKKKKSQEKMDEESSEKEKKVDKKTKSEDAKKSSCESSEQRGKKSKSTQHEEKPSKMDVEHKSSKKSAKKRVSSSSSGSNSDES